jgi:hypothetical protein
VHRGAPVVAPAKDALPEKNVVLSTVTIASDAMKNVDIFRSDNDEGIVRSPIRYLLGYLPNGTRDNLKIPESNVAI